MEIEELRAEVRRGEQRLRTAHRDMKSMQVGLTRCATPSQAYGAGMTRLCGLDTFRQSASPRAVAFQLCRFTVICAGQGGAALQVLLTVPG